MAIHNNNGTFKEVNKVFCNRSGSNARIQKVWVHNGTKYVMVKGRILELLWEKDMSTYGGMSWENEDRSPENNVIVTPQILDNGDLMGVIKYVVNNNSSNQYSTNRYALIKLSAGSGELSAFSTYNNWLSWSAVSGYKNTAQPIGVIRCGDNFVAYADIGSIFYTFNSSGQQKHSYEDVEWHTDSTAKYMPESNYWGISVAYEEQGSCIYYILLDQNPNNKDSSNFLVSVYRIGVNGTNITSPRRHYLGEREYRYYGYSSSVFIDNETRTGVALFTPNYSEYPIKLVVFPATKGYSSTTTDVSATCTLNITEDEYPVAAKDGYVYTLNQFSAIIRKRSLSDLSLIWESQAPELSHNDFYHTHQPLPEVDGGFMLSNGSIVYPDGYISKGTKIWDSSTYGSQHEIQSYCYDKDKNIGYLMNWVDSSNQVCKVIKFKEVVK